MSDCRSKLLKNLSGYAAFIFIFLVIIIDTIAVFGEVMLQSVCHLEETNLKVAELSLRVISFTMLFLLLIHILLIAILEGLLNFFTKWLNVIDFILIIVSIILDFTIPIYATPLIALPLIWRVLRIIHSLYEQIEAFSISRESDKNEIERLKAILLTYSTEETKDNNNNNHNN